MAKHTDPKQARKWGPCVPGSNPGSGNISD